MNEHDGGDSPLSVIYEKPNVLNIDPQEFDHPNPNLILLRDSCGFEGDSIESGDEHLSAPT